MNKKISLIKNVLMMFIIVVVFTGTTGCGKPGSVLNGTRRQNDWKVK